MKRVIILAAAAAIAVAATPALAKSKKKYRVQQPYYGETLCAGPRRLLGRDCSAGRAAVGAATIPRSVTPPRPHSRAPAAGASRTSATAASSIAAGERAPVSRLRD